QRLYVPFYVSSLSYAPSMTAIFSLTLHDALPIYPLRLRRRGRLRTLEGNYRAHDGLAPKILRLGLWASRVAPTLSSRARVGYLRSEEHTSELQSRENLVCRLLLEKNIRTFYVQVD